MADSEVQLLYKSYLAEGKTPKDAAKEAQKRTGFAMVTNRPIKPKGLKFSKEGVTYGQNEQLKSSRSSQKQGIAKSQYT